jgi:hypothetical protein
LHDLFDPFYGQRILCFLTSDLEAEKVCLSDDPDYPGLFIAYWQTAHLVPNHQPGRRLNGRLGRRSDDVGSHQINYTHSLRTSALVFDPFWQPGVPPAAQMARGRHTLQL